MGELVGNLGFLLAQTSDAHGDDGGPMWLALIPLLSLGASAAALTCLAMKVKTKLPAWIVVGALAASFVLVLFGFLGWQGAADEGGHIHAQIVSVYEWIGISWGDGAGESLSAPFGFYMDGLSWLWMLFVTGLATLIALYASEYMEQDVGKGYARFFAAFALFVFSMACLVMGNNLLLLYLGWEGVGLCSYLLIGYFFKRPSAVAAAKKAFIVNRIGDLGLALGLFLAFVTFGTIQYDEIFGLVARDVMANGEAYAGTWQSLTIPLLVLVGAIGKSAQFPLYVWLPDAMEGPTPVSALIHAATMVTAGVYLVARMMPLYLADTTHTALTIVAWVGAITAILSATIGMAQFDIKRIMAYSTVSQLGYMFAGLGMMASTGAAFHVFTHAFFKALLFLACGAVMHGFAGQLDLRKLSGVQKIPGWRIVGFTMLIGCLNLSGFPGMSGYFSKDMILAEAFVTPDEIIAGSSWIGWILLVTAGMTAYYTFRVYFRVFLGPVQFEPGDELHEDEDHGEDNGHHQEFHPHAPGRAINAVLVILAACSLLAIPTYFMGEHHGWVGGLVHHSSAAIPESAAPWVHHEVEGQTGGTPVPLGQHETGQTGGTPVPLGQHELGETPVPLGEHETGETPVLLDHEVELHAGTLFGFDPHKAMFVISAWFGLVGIGIAWWLHLAGRTLAATSRADTLLLMLGPIPKWAQHKWYVDELYDFLFVKPLWVMAHVFYAIDKLLVDGLVNLCGIVPRWLAESLRPSQSGMLHGYALGMATGLVAVLLIVLFLMTNGGGS